MRTENGTVDNASVENGPIENGPIENRPIQNGLIENGSVENGSGTGRPPTRRRLPRDPGVGRSFKSDNSRCQTGQHAQSRNPDRTNIPNLEGQGSRTSAGSLRV